MNYRTLFAFWTVIAAFGMLFGVKGTFEARFLGILLVSGIFAYAVSGIKAPPRL